LQLNPSSQEVPSGLAGLLHNPVAGAHVPASWHAFNGVHTTGFDPLHVPDWQVSVCVQPSLSLQDVPSGLAGLLQRPVSGAQVPASWHWSRGLQTTGFDPLHVPAWQVSDCVQPLSSLQEVPLARAGCVQVPAAQTSFVQGFPSSAHAAVLLG
jgi:hypothetical protein